MNPPYASPSRNITADPSPQCRRAHPVATQRSVSTVVNPGSHGNGSISPTCSSEGRISNLNAHGAASCSLKVSCFKTPTRPTWNDHNGHGCTPDLGSHA